MKELGLKLRNDEICTKIEMSQDFLGSGVERKPPANAGDAEDVGSTPRLGKFPRVGNGNLLQYSCLENSMDRGAREATVHGVAKS